MSRANLSSRLTEPLEIHSRNVGGVAPWVHAERVVDAGFGLLDSSQTFDISISDLDSDVVLGLSGYDEPVCTGHTISSSNRLITVELENISHLPVYGNFQKRVILTTKQLKDMGGIVSFPITTRNFTVHKQPYLVDGPDPTTGYEHNENQMDAGGFSSRPVEVCGGFAMYDGKTNEKFGTLTRPHIFLDGVEGLKDHPDFPGYPIPVIELEVVLGDFRYVVDPVWLASIGDGWIVIDPNLGFDDPVGSTNGFNTARVNYGQFTEGGSAGSYDTFFVYNGSDTTPTEIGTAVYTDSAGAPNTLTQCGTPITGVTGWGSAAIPTINTSSSEIVWLAFQAGNGIGGTDMLDPRYDLTGGIHEQANPGTYVICADPANRTSTTTGTRRYSVYLRPVSSTIIERTLSDSIDVIDSSNKDVLLQRLIHDDVDLSDFLTRDLSFAIQIITRLLSDSVDLYDSISADLIKIFESILSDQVNVSDFTIINLIKIIDRTVSDSLLLSDDTRVEFIRVLERVLPDSIDLSDDLVRILFTGAFLRFLVMKISDRDIEMSLSDRHMLMSINDHNLKGGLQ